MTQRLQDSRSNIPCGDPLSKTALNLDGRSVRDPAFGGAVVFVARFSQLIDMQ